MGLQLKNPGFTPLLIEKVVNDTPGDEPARIFRWI